MAWSVTILGETFTNANVEGNAYADEAAGMPAILARVAELGSMLLGPGAVSTSSESCGTGARSLTLAAAATLPAGTYRVRRAADASVFMICTLAAPLVAGTALELTCHIAVNAGGPYTDWIIEPLTGSRMARAAKTGAYSVVAADHGALIDCSGGSYTVSLPAAATAGAGYRVAVLNSGAGTITVDPDGAELVAGRASILLPPGHTADLVCTGAAWLLLGRPYTVRQTVVYPAGALAPDPTSPAEAAVAALSGGRALEVLAYDPAVAERAWAQLTLPASWAAGSTIRARVQSIRLATAATHGVAWLLAGVASGAGESAAVAPATAADILVALSGLDWIVGGEADDTIALPVAGSPQPGDVLSVYVERGVSRTADDMSADAGLAALALEIDCLRGGDDA